MKSDCIYLDYQATTPLDPRVAAAMQPYWGPVFGNPHSEHVFGWEAADGVDRANAAVAGLIGATPNEIVFTSGATEANNLAIQGVARSSGRRGNHIVTTAIEHKCVLHTALSLRRRGFDVDVISVQRDGLVDPKAVIDAVGDETALVSVMLANNEIGTLQPISEIGAFCQTHGIVMHTDAAQAVGKVPVDVSDLRVDLLSLSGHKLYGPKGIGALYVSRHCPLALEPLIIGGAQQSGLRAGTVPAPLAVGLGEACRLAQAELEADPQRNLALRDVFLATLKEAIPDLAVNGDLAHRLPGNLNLRLPGLDANSLLTTLQGQIAASTGSACNAGFIEPSYVLIALGLSMTEVNSSIRFGFGRFSNHDTVLKAAKLIVNKVRSLRRTLAYS